MGLSSCKTGRISVQKNPGLYKVPAYKQILGIRWNEREVTPQHLHPASVSDAEGCGDPAVQCDYECFWQAPEWQYFIQKTPCPLPPDEGQIGLGFWWNRELPDTWRAKDQVLSPPVGARRGPPCWSLSSAPSPPTLDQQWRQAWREAAVSPTCVPCPWEVLEKDEASRRMSSQL
jgi:hypothetical protein